MAGQISLVIASLFKSQGLNQARQALLGAQRDFSSLASTIGQAAGAFGAFQAITSSRQFITDSVDAAQRFERNILALKQVFEEAAPAIRNFTMEVENYGLSQQQAAQASVFLGSVLKQYGFSVSESAAQTKQLVTLAQDLATTYGYDVQEALLAITALFRGEYDPIEKFGVAMKQNEINAYLAAQGLQDLEGQERLNAEAIARLTLLFDRAGDSVGAFDRAITTLYGSQQLLNAQIQNLQIAFGAELQRPLADVINQFAELVDKYGPEFEEIARAIGKAIEGVTPTFVRIGETFFNLIALTQPVIELLSMLANILGSVLNPVLDIVNGALKGIVQFFDTWSAVTEAASVSIRRLTAVVEDNPLFKATIGALFSRIALGFEMAGKALDFLNDQMIKSEQNARAVTGEFEGFDNGVKRASVSMRASGLAARDAADAIVVAAESTSYFQMELEGLGIATEDAEGKLTGLAAVFAEIDEEARKSEAKEALDEIGFSAGQIETILTRPDWAQIFGEISRLAKITSLDISKSMSVTAVAAFYNAQAALEELLKSLAGDSSRGTVARDFVKDFLSDLADEVNKQTARGALENLGIASDGLLNEIFGSEGWEEVYKNILQGGTEYLKDLQDQFELTADGMREITEIMERERKQQEKDAADALRALEEQRQALEEYNQEVERRIDLAEEFRATIRDISIMDVLDENQRQIGRYEASVAGFFDNILSNLERAFDNETILEDAYNELRNYAAAERAVFTSIQRQRDDIANRINLSEALINEYRSAFSSSASLVSLLGQIENKTSKITVTEMTEGMVTLNSSLKEFKVTLTRSFEEAEAETVDKTTKLISDFRNIAEKARAFAQNLRTLRDMGLNPMLFNQLVEAGVEAGGETAQALVDGGAETVNEVSALFAEIDSLGAGLGEEVASTMYGAGVDMSNGLIEGLKSQAEAIKNAAESLATGFADAFTAKIDAAVAEALKKLASVNAPTGETTYEFGSDTLGQPTVTVNPGLNLGTPVQLPQVIMPAPLPTMPLTQTGLGGLPTFNIYADSRYGGYQAATAFTAQQSRLATNNAGISAFMKI